MSTFGIRNNKALSQGAQTLPGYGGMPRRSDAALFTQMTASTEAWKQEPVKKARAPRTEKQRQMVVWSAAAVAVVLAVIALILYVQPVNRVVRAINAGEYAEAKEIYWSSTLVSGDHDRELKSTLLKAAEQVCEQYAMHEIDADTAAGSLSDLGSIGMGAEALLSGYFDDFRTYAVSQNHMAQAEALSREGEFLSAREEYLMVTEGDSRYREAQRSADVSLDQYADSVMDQADICIQSKDYGQAIELLEEGRRVLLSYVVYNEKLEYKLGVTYELYAESLLEQAAALAAAGKYDEAAAFLREGINRFNYETELLTAAEASYIAESRTSAVSEAVRHAQQLYQEQNYTEAFAALDVLQTEPELPQDQVSAAISAMEATFASDMMTQAAEKFAGSRETLPEAVQALETAIRIRPIPELVSCQAELAAYLPASLYDLQYAEKVGSIFRSSGEFAALNGVTYRDGWVWGEDGSEMTFDLNGAYDLLEGTFAVRRDDENTVSGYFEVICDGKTVFTSETLYHPTEEAIPVSVDISGCNTLTLRFHNDYTVRTAEDGYCYHGLCSPVITKNLPQV